MAPPKQPPKRSVKPSSKTQTKTTISTEGTLQPRKFPWKLLAVGILIAGTASFFWGQRKAVISGQIVDTGTGNPLGDVSVSLEGHESTTSQESTGTFRFTVPAGSYTVRIKHSGYDTYQETTVVKAGGKQRLAISLNPQRKEDSLSNQYTVIPLASGGVQLIETNTLRNFGTLNSGGGILRDAIGIPGTRKIYAAIFDKQHIAVIDFASRLVTKTIPLPERSAPSDLVLSSDGNYVYMLDGGTGEVRILDARQDTLLPTAVSFKSLPQALAAQTGSGQLLVMRVNGLDILSPSGILQSSTDLTEFWGKQIAYDANSQSIFVAGQTELVQLSGASNIQRHPMPKLVSRVAVDKRTGGVYVAFVGELALYQPSTGQFISEPRALGGEHIVDMQDSPDGSKLWILNSQSRNITLLDKATGEATTADVRLDGEPLSLSFVKLEE